MSNAESFEDIQQQKEQAEVKLEEAKSLQLIEGKQNQEIANYTDDRDLANQLIGRIQMSYGFTKMATVSSLSDLAYVKEHKLYKALAGKNINGKNVKMETVTTWDGFCNALGMSRRKVDEDLMNLATFGEEALDAMNKVGVGYRQMRLLRKLPEKDLTIVVNDVESSVGDKDAIIELIEDITIKHSKEKEALQKQLDEAQANKEANDRYMETKEQKINDLEKVVNKCLTPDEQRQHHLDQEQVLQNELSLIEMECTLAIDKLDLAIGKIYNHPKCSEELEQMPHKLYEYLLKHLVNVADQYQMQFDVNQILDPILYGLINTAPQDGNG